MDKKEAQEILNHQIEIYREKAYDQLAELIDSEHIFAVMGNSGTEYQIEVQAFWDSPNKPHGNLRVIMSIDDGKILSSLLPMSTDFIMDPKGNFIGE